MATLFYKLTVKHCVPTSQTSTKPKPLTLSRALQTVRHTTPAEIEMAERQSKRGTRVGVPNRKSRVWPTIHWTRQTTILFEYPIVNLGRVCPFVRQTKPGTRSEENEVTSPSLRDGPSEKKHYHYYREVRIQIRFAIGSVEWKWGGVAFPFPGIGWKTPPLVSAHEGAGASVRVSECGAISQIMIPYRTSCPPFQRSGTRLRWIDEVVCSTTPVRLKPPGARFRFFSWRLVGTHGTLGWWV